MKTNGTVKTGRRAFLCLTAIALAFIVLPFNTAAADIPSLKIGIVGAGKIGGTLGELWARRLR